MPTNETERSDEAVPGHVASTDRLGRIRLPRTADVWKPPEPSSLRRKIARNLAPNPGGLVYYPDLPPFETAIWCLWRDGRYGNCVYIGGWTYRADSGEFVNDMPVCWCLRPNVI
jgi:hypothetical protein